MLRKKNTRLRCYFLHVLSSKNFCIIISLKLSPVNEPKMFVSVFSVMSYVADFSHLFLVASIVLLFGILIVFIKKNIFWLHGEDFFMEEGPVMSRQHIREMDVIKIDVPFFVKLNCICVDDPNGVTCEILTRVPSKLFVFWGVSINNFHYWLKNSWKNGKPPDVVECLSGNVNFEFEYKNELECAIGKDVQYFLRPKNLNLGFPPRSQYPLVVIVARVNSQSCLRDDSVALVNIIHVKDTICPESSSILMRYTKCASGQLTIYRPLYLAAGNTSELDQRGRELTCVVCLSNPLSLALLPCGHICVCHSCFSKLEVCPICRGRIMMYFAIEKIRSS